MADSQLAAVKALAAQAGSGPAARQSLIASGAVPKLVKNLSSKTAAITSQSALALSLLASDPDTRSSVWEHQRALVPALVQTLKTGGPLTQERSLAALAALIEHVPKAGAAVIKANGILPILRLMQTGSDAVRNAAVSALNAFHVAVEWRAKRPADDHTFPALQHTRDLGEPLIRALSGGPEGAKLFALGVLRVLEGQPKVAQGLRRPAVTALLNEFAAADVVDIAATSLEVLTFAFAPRNCPEEVAPQDAAYRASSTLCNLWETLPCRVQSRHPSKHALALAAVRYVDVICGWPGVTAMLWFRQCVRSIPGLLQSPSDAVKIRGLYLARHAWLDRQTPEMEELCEALPLIISHLDPQPQTSPGGVQEDLTNFGHGAAKDPDVMWLARQTYKKRKDHMKALVSAGDDSSLRPTPKFISRAELAEAAGHAVETLSVQPWGFQALLRTSLFTLAKDLVKKNVLPRGIVAVWGRLFSCEYSADPQRLTLARSHLRLEFTQYLSECITGGPPKVVETAKQAMDWVTRFVAENAGDPEFPTDSAIQALLSALSPSLRSAEAFAALLPGVEAGLNAIFTPGASSFDAHMVGGVGVWATTIIDYEDAPLHTKVVAWRLLTTAAICAERNTGYVVLPISDMSIVVGAALRPPAEPGSQEAMRLLCILTRSFHSGYTIDSAESDIPSQETPASAAQISPESGLCGIRGSGDGGNSEAGSNTPETPADVAHGADADLARHAPDLERSPPADLAPAKPADLAPNPPADLAPYPPADLASYPLADLAPNPPADSVRDTPPDLVSDMPNAPAELVPDAPADLKPKTLADLAPNTRGGGANEILSEMVRLGAAKAAIAHFKSFPAPPAPGGNCRPSGLDRGAVAKFLCRLSWASGGQWGREGAKGALPDMRENGGLQILVDLLRWGEGNERTQAIEAIAMLAYVEPAARAPLRAVGAITHLATQVEGLSGMDAILTMLGLCVLIREETGRQPLPGAVDEVVATGAVPPLLRIVASQDESATSAFATLRYIACEPCGVAAIMEADYARPLVTALGLPFRSHDTNKSVVERTTRVDVICMINKIAEERPEKGEALVAAGLAPHLATIFSSPLDMVERKLAMQLVEKLSCHVPSAWDVLMDAGVLAEVHTLAVAAPDSADLRYAADTPGAEELDPLAFRTPEGVSEAEAVQARALLCRLAGYCGGVLEFASMEGEPVRYTESGYTSGPWESDTRQSHCGTPCRETADDVPKKPLARSGHASKKVCSMCGVVSEKRLKVCAVCRRARYCGHDCQVAHWPVHKVECCR